ncbi:DUF559 domain-containing protein [Amycolatopsis sp.]|uniref:endonuclease domain-containing protein n=1 Tax=Amycolatopsis sp. TaxID=37632 RepID=UPI00260F290A|nr:DUF559 domain-containing protein [Amycolatopsis sp.]
MIQLDVIEPGDISGPFLGSHAVSEGVLSAAQLRSPMFRRLFQNVYLPTGIPLTHEVKARAAALIVPVDAVLTGCSAAAVRGFAFATPEDQVEFVVPEKAKFLCQRGMNICRTTIGEIDSESWGDNRIATDLRMTLDILTNTRLRRSLPRVVGFLDAILRAGKVDVDVLRVQVDSRHDHGIVRARQAVGLSDPRAESVPESEVRVWLTLNGMQPEPQVNVFHRGKFLGRLDLAFPECKLAVEYDGAWHQEDDQPLLDARRRAAFLAAGWDFVVITKDQLYEDPQGMVEAVRRRLDIATRRRLAVS